MYDVLSLISLRRKQMKQKTPRMMAWAVCAVVIVLGECWPAPAQDSKPYASMAPLVQYLMADRNAEIALARSAAPAAISSEAEVLVLGRNGYETPSKARTVL